MLGRRDLHYRQRALDLVLKGSREYGRRSDDASLSMFCRDRARDVHGGGSRSHFTLDFEISVSSHTTVFRSLREIRRARSKSSVVHAKTRAECRGSI